MMNPLVTPRRTVLMTGLIGFILIGGATVVRAHTDDMRAQFAAAEAAAFTQADANGDGKLTPEEFANFHDIMRQQLETARFAHLDTNGDGTLSKAELDAGHGMGHGGPPCGGPRF